MLTNIKTAFARFAKDESGAALMEYSLLIAIVTATAVGLVFGVGDWVAAQWTNLADDLDTNSTTINIAGPNADGGGTTP